MTRVLLTRLHGDGTETLVADEVPVTGLQVMTALSGAGGVTGTIAPEVTRLRDHTGGVLLVPGRTGVYVLTDAGYVLGGGILTPESTRTGAQHRLDAEGHAGFLRGQPYAGDTSWVQADPADLIRHAWAHVQSRPLHDLGVVVDDTTTPVRVGTEAEDVAFATGDGQDVAFEAGPVRWAWWSTHDLGREVDRLAVDTPVEYAMTHTWDGATITHRLALGYPRLGRRRHDLTFTVGINILTEPVAGTAEDVSDVVVLGAGAGSEQRRGVAHRDVPGLGRTVTVTDKTLTTNAACAQAAREHLAWSSGGDDVQQVTVHDHPNAPLESWGVGDDIHLTGGGTGWAGDLDLWVRVLSVQTSPVDGVARATLTRADRTA